MDFTIWKNKHKKTEKQPDYQIRQKNAQGEWVDIGAAWKKTVKDKVDEKGQPVTYLSCRLKTEEKKSVFTDEERRTIEIAKNAEAIKHEVVASGQIDPNEIPF